MNTRKVPDPLIQTGFDNIVDLSKVMKAVFYIAISAVTLICVNMLQNPIDFSAISVVSLLFVILLLYYFFTKGHYRKTSLGLVTVISFIITYNIIIDGGIHDNAMVIFPVLITISGLVIGRRYIPVMTGIVLAEITVIYILTVAGVIMPFGGVIKVRFLSYVIVAVLMVVAGIVIWITMLTIEKNYLQLLDVNNRLQESYDRTIDGWSKALELFDRDTEGHSRRVTDLCLTLARKLNLLEEEVEHIRRGALLHDIGKMGVAEEVLNKRGTLSPEERALVERHPLHAYVLLKDIPFLEKAIDIPLYHHERWDGTGYPYFLTGEDIPLAARIFAIVDNWDALTSDRPYRKAWPREKVIQYIRDEKGNKFDPDLVDLFLESAPYDQYK